MSTLSDNDLERIEREGFTFADVRGLLAEVRLGREAIKALENLYDGVMPALYDDEITANDPRSQARMVEHLRKLPALLNAASIILRKAGRR